MYHPFFKLLLEPYKRNWKFLKIKNMSWQENPKNPFWKNNSPTGEISPMQKGLVTGNLGKGYGVFFWGVIQFRI
jgi:hypothetical protein